MPNYSAGTLDLSILGYSDSAVLSITKTVRALNSLTNAITKMQGVNFGAQANKLTRFFDKMAKSTNEINPAKLQILASVASSFRGISSISKLDKMDYDKIATGFSKLTVAITPFVNKVKEAEASLVALRGILSASGRNAIARVTGAGNSANGRFLGGLFKISVVVRLAKMLGREVANIIKAGSDYLETMNLWQVAMRENLDLAEEFVNKMNKAYGVSTKTVMQAQATFKNMIGSLGDLSSETAYQLSEAITMMAMDYSSLYNVQLEKAVEKFQSALAGQVRPIRSVSGYDITEKTIHALYQSLGGTKTQRQLSRTEKQLLAILAIYRQMGESGALGDMNKTLNQFANQSRMMSEYWTELKSWTGLVLKDLIDQWGVMIKLNALLITFTEIMKAIAKDRGLGEDNFVDGIFESAENANDEIDELQGKLLDFDKFRSLSGQEETVDVSIDQVLLDAIGNYTSLLNEANNEAEKLAEIWKQWWISEDGGLTEQARTLLDVLKAIGVVLLSFAAASLFSGIAKMFKLLTALNGTTVVLVTGFSLLAYGVISFVSAMGEMSGVQKWITVIFALVAAVVAFKIALSSLGSVTLAIAAGAAVTGAILAASSAIKFDIPNYENGASDIDSGTVFRAGEFGKTEAVYTGSNGKTNVANVKQIEQAQFNALVRYRAQYRDDDRPIVVYLDGEKVYQNTTAHAKQRGKVWANV